MRSAERRFDMMAYLCKVRSATMSELATQFGVSVRTVKRDIDELGCIIPLVTKVGRYTGGVYVMDGYFWDRAYMSHEDIAMLETLRDKAYKQEPIYLDELAIKRLERIIEAYSMPERK